MAEYDFDYGEILAIEEEDYADSLDEDDVIEEPDDDPTIPDTDTSDGSGGDPSAIEEVDYDDEEDPDSFDEDSDLDETDIIDEIADLSPDTDTDPLFTNEDELETIGSVDEDDEVMIMIVDGEPVVIGSSGSGDILQGKVDYLEVNALTADSAIIEDLEAETAKIENLTASELEAAVAYIDDLTAGSITANNIIADHATLSTIDANYVSTQYLTANYITAGQIASAYAALDAANITDASIKNAWINSLLVQTNLLAKQGQVFSLDAIEVNADRITAGTIDVQRMIITQNGHKYVVTFDSQGTPTYQKLDGDIIEDLTITGDKIVANTITANKITTQNLVGTNGWINVANGTFQYGVPTTGSGISWDGSNLVVNADNIKLSDTDIITIIDQHAQNSTIIREYENGVLVAKIGQTVGALVNADGSFDIVSVTWDSNNIPTAGDATATFGDTTRIGNTDSSNLYLDDEIMQFNTEYGTALEINAKGSSDITYMNEKISTGGNSTNESPLVVTDDRLVAGTSAAGGKISFHVYNNTTGYHTIMTFYFGTSKESNTGSVARVVYDGADTFTVYPPNNSQITSHRIGDIYVAAPLSGQPSPTFSLGARSENDTTPGAYSSSFGYNNVVGGKYAMAVGTNLYSDGDYGLVVGRNNKRNVYNQLFTVGNGTSTSVRKDVFYITTGGNAYLDGKINLSEGLNTGSRASDTSDTHNPYYSDMYVMEHDTPIGFVKCNSRTSSIQLTTGVARSVLSIDLEAGLWCVTCGVRFDSSYKGVRRANLTTTANDTDIQYQVPAYAVGSSGSLGATMQINFTRWCRPIVLTTPTTYYLNAYQNSGNNINCLSAGSDAHAQVGTYIYAVRIL